MTDFVTELTTQLTTANLWGALTPLAGLIGIAVIFSLSIHFARKLVRGIGKGKAQL